MSNPEAFKNSPWKPGISGNPSGRPKIFTEVRELARANSVAAVQKLVELMNHDNPKVAIAACNSILDRACGKAPQAIAFTDEDGKSIASPILNVILNSGNHALPAPEAGRSLPKLGN